jgi:hypothetical protein
MTRSPPDAASSLSVAAINWPKPGGSLAGEFHCPPRVDLVAFSHLNVSLSTNCAPKPRAPFGAAPVTLIPLVTRSIAADIFASDLARRSRALRSVARVTAVAIVPGSTPRDWSVKTSPTAWSYCS